MIDGVYQAAVIIWKKHKGINMKTILTAVFTVFAMMGAAYAQKMPKNSATYDAQVLRVSDGDTIVIAAPFLPAPLKPELAVRIYGVDTPEKGHRAQCAQENERALVASNYTKQLIAQGGKIQVTLYGWDKFGGRVLGDIIVNGQSVRAGLIANGLAREYYGDAKQSWCQ
jgi:endonuclease YncB( thermonuclease family)